MERPKLKDDFYGFINHKWLENVEIPADKSAYGSFTAIDQNVENLLIQDSNNWLRNKTLIPCRFPLIRNYVEFYAQAMDFEKREALGLEPLKELLKQVILLENFDEFSRHYHEFILKDFKLPLNFGLMEDFLDNSKMILVMDIANLILPEKGYYADKEKAKALLDSFAASTKKLLLRVGHNEIEADTMIEKAIKFDQILVDYTLSAEEQADYTKLYNPINYEDIISASKNIKVQSILEKLITKEIPYINLVNPKLLEGLNEIFTISNFEIIKAWTYVMNVIDLARYADDQSRIISGEFRRSLTGTSEAKPFEKVAYNIANGFFSQVIGLYYGHKYFGSEARDQVISMVKEMIQVYKARLSKNTWLSEATKEKAILKLDKLELYVGYPDHIHPFYANLKVKPYESGGNLITNVIAFRTEIQKYEFSRYLEPIDKSLWHMSPAMVNAYYNPFHNHIVFPAAILQKPFYDLNQPMARNYGAIGAVIAHEISHAFDNNGAKFDENGNMNNWWTEEDNQRFNELVEKMVVLFDKVPTEAGECNGRLTVSENIADCGGLRCALSAAKKVEGFEPKDFFAGWATSWRFKAKEEYQKILLRADVHAPAKLRCNIQLMNLSLFQKTFDIKEGDGMYLPKEKWVRIW